MSYAPLPTAAEISLTRQQIFEQRCEIAAVEAQIQVHANCIAALRSKISTIRADIASKDAYLAPVRRLPFEVLGEIITLRATDPNSSVQVVRDLSSICRKWRDATLRTPKAWTKISVRIPLRDQPDYGSETSEDSRGHLTSFRDVQEWYDRSGCCQKDVSITWIDSQVTEEVDSIFQLVFSRITELRTLVAQGMTGSSDYLIRPMPSIQALDLSELYDSDDARLLSFAVSSSPRLSCLRAGEISSQGLPFSFLLPFQGRLRGLEAHAIHCDEFFAMLRPRPGFLELQVLIIHDLRPALTASDQTVLSLPNLRSIYLCCNLEELIIQVFDLVKMPQLESLALSGDSWLVTRLKDAGTAALHRFVGNQLLLRELRLGSISISDADLLELLKRMPRLETLVLVNCMTSDQVISALSREQGHPARWLCPSLSRICIMSDDSPNPKEYDESMHAMSRLVMARLLANQNIISPRNTPPVARLMAVRLDDNDLRLDDLHNVGCVWEQDHSFDDCDAAPQVIIADSEHEHLKRIRWWMLSPNHWAELW